MISPSNNGALRIVLVMAICGLFHPSSDVAYARPQEPTATAMSVPDGTPVHLYLMDDLNSKKNKDGDAVRFKVREGVQVYGVEIIPAGSPVLGHVVKVGHSSFAGHSGKLGLSIDYAMSPNGTKIPLRGEATLKGGSNGAVTAAATVYWGPPALLMRGWDAEIHKGTMLNAYVNGNQTVTLGDAAAGASQISSTAPSQATGNTAALLGLTLTSWEGGGAKIAVVAPNSPAQTAGLQVGYVIHAVDQKPVLNAEDFEAALENRAPGTAIKIDCAFRSTAMGWMPKRVVLSLQR
jgi:hypothetical protein